MEDYVDIVIPLKNNTHGKKKMLSFEMITRWFNMKSILDGSEQVVTPYQDFPFKFNNFPIFWAIYISQLVPISNGRK